MSRRRRVTAAVVGVLVLVLLAGCDLWVPQSTLTNGETSDGVSGQVGDVYVANAVLIADSRAANLVLSLVNEGSMPVDVSVVHGTDSTSTTIVRADTGLTQIGTPGRQLVVLRDFGAPAGSLYDVYFVYGDHTGLRLGVPVLGSDQPQYRDLAPDHVTSSQAP